MRYRKLKSAAIGLVFVLILLAVVDFQIGSIIDIKIFLSMLLGVALLTKASYKGETTDVDRLVAYHCALTSVFASTLIYLERLSSEAGGLITLPIKPLLYGILIYIGFVVTRINSKDYQNLDDNVEGLDKDDSTADSHDIKVTSKPSKDKSYNQQLYKMGLSDREVSIAIEILKRKTNKEIASEFFIAESTVKKHVQNILRKADVANRQEFCRVVEADKND